ncbi:MAG: hypothetical protein ACI4OS_04315 [Akkermansia sp.]
MKATTTLLAAALLSAPVFAAADADFATLPTLSAKRLSGALTAGYETNYTGRGMAPTNAITEGEGSEMIALQYSYDMGSKSRWSWEGAIVYRMISSGHTLYGNPTFGGQGAVAAAASTVNNTLNNLRQTSGVDYWNLALTDEQRAGYVAAAEQTPIKQANIENEFIVQNGPKYTTQYWNVALGHTFIHGGMLGVMAKHYRDQGASCVNEVFIRPEVTPFPWLSIGCDVRFSFQGITGWWFVPDVTFKAPLIGTPEDVKLAGVVQFGMSATADYYAAPYFACDNGSQAFWIKVSTPWFVTPNFILTPSVSFNWLGKGGEHANGQSEYRFYSGSDANVPFEDFRIIGGLMATYKF